MTNDDGSRRGRGVVVCVSVTPALQRTLRYPHFRPGAVNRATGLTLSAAGKATNVTRVLHRLGADAVLIGFAGGAAGDAYECRVREEGLPFVRVASGAETRICQTLIGEHDAEVTELVEEAVAPTEEEWARLEAALRERLPGAERLLLSGKLPPGSPDSVYARWVEMARQQGVPVCIDTQGEPLLKAADAGPGLVKINAEELAATFPPDTDGPQGLQQGIDCLRERGVKQVLITRGQRPALLVGEGGAYRYRIPALEAVNPIGSGDATLAGIAFGLGDGRSLPESVRFGLACGCANALTDSPGRVEPADLDRLAPLIEIEEVGA